MKKIQFILLISFVLSSCSLSTKNEGKVNQTETRFSINADASKEIESEMQILPQPFVLELPKDTTIEYDFINNIWKIVSDRENKLSQYGELSNRNIAGWIDETKGEVYVNIEGYPYYMQNHSDAYDYEEYDFGLLCTWECDVYSSIEIVEYSIPEDDRINLFWNVIIINKENDCYYWLFFNQKCFTKEEVLQIAESVSF